MEIVVPLEDTIGIIVIEVPLDDTLGIIWKL